MICVIGAGNMGQALAAGLIAAGHDDLVLVERRPQRQEALRKRFPTARVADQPEACSGAIIAVKPKDVESAVSGAVAAGAERIVSVATGISLQALSATAGVPVARAMPNVGALVGRSATSVCAETPEMLHWAMEIMKSVGTVVEVNESTLHAATALAGSGPAYVFLVAEAMVEAGVSAGLPHPTALALTVATLQGAGELLAQDGETAAQLRAKVSTPGGVTVEGVRVLEQRAVRAAFLDAISAAAARSRELTTQSAP